MADHIRVTLMGVSGSKRIEDTEKANELAQRLGLQVYRTTSRPRILKCSTGSKGAGSKGTQNMLGVRLGNKHSKLFIKEPSQKKQKKVQYRS